MDVDDINGYPPEFLEHRNPYNEIKLPDNTKALGLSVNDKTDNAAVVSDKGSLLIVSLASGSVIRKEDYNDKSHLVCIDPVDPNLILTGGHSKHVRFYDLRTKKVEALFEGKGPKTISVS